ncbi:MAG: type IV toxin-antitoxin system AbiEi family antitoxin domain-containing protein [Kineosporiaceae bacterium]
MTADLGAALAAHRGVASVADLVRAGVSRKVCHWAVSSGTALRVGRGVVADPAVWASLDDRGRHVSVCRALVGRCRSEVVLAAHSAAVAWGLPTRGGPPRTPVLLQRRTAGRPEFGGRSESAVRRRAWVRDDDLAEVEGLAVTSLARTVVDVARHEPVVWGLAAADAARARGGTREDLLAAVHAVGPVPGSRRAALVARWADGRAESPLESVARGTVLLLGLPPPDLQVRLDVGDRRYRVDLLVREFCTVVEVDGKVKYEDREQSWRDKRRRDDLLETGHEVARFVASDAYRPARWGRRLLQTFQRAAARHGLPDPAVDPSFPSYHSLPPTWRLDA